MATSQAQVPALVRGLCGVTSASLPLRDRVELCAARALRAYYARVGSAAEHASGQAPHTYEFKAVKAVKAVKAAQGEVAGALGTQQAIPRVVWAYWAGAEMPPLIARCVANWKRMCPTMEIRVLNDDSARKAVGTFPPQLANASATLRADWLRLALLQRHGGIWLDASTVLTQSLDWVLEQQAQSQADLVAYFLDRYTHDAAFPVVENWFLAAPPGSPFVADLLGEFTERVLVLGGAGYAAELEKQGDYAQLLQGIDMPHYLSMHLAIQKLLRDVGGYRLSLRRAEDGPFLYHAAGGWDRTALKIRLLFKRSAEHPPPLIKLRKPDRKRLDLYLERGLYLPQSTVGLYLCPDAPSPACPTPSTSPHPPQNPAP